MLRYRVVLIYMKQNFYEFHKKQSKFSRVWVAQRNVLFYFSTKTSPWVARSIVWHVFFVGRVVSSILSWGFLGFLIEFFFSRMSIYLWIFHKILRPLDVRSHCIQLTMNSVDFFLSPSSRVLYGFNVSAILALRPPYLWKLYPPPISYPVLYLLGQWKGGESIRLCK